MSDMRRQIVDALEKIKYEKNSNEKYKVILDFVRNHQIETTKNLRGYWFDLATVSDTCVKDLHDLVLLQLNNKQ